MGTMLQQQRLTADDFGGAALEGCNENLVRTRPDVVLGIHRAYLEAGSDVVETNSFGGTKLVLAEYGLADDAYELNFTAAKLARQAADEFSRFVAGSMGPTTKAITVTGGVTFPQLGPRTSTNKPAPWSRAARTSSWSKPARTRATSSRPAGHRSAAH